MEVIIFVGAALVCFAVAAAALKNGWILGIAFRSRFIARRVHEPGLYWASVAIFSAFGGILIYAIISTQLFYRTH